MSSKVKTDMVKKDDLLSKYKEYIKNIPSITSSFGIYGTYLSKIPFAYIKKVMDHWEISKDSKDKYKLRIRENSKVIIDSDSRTYYLWQYFKSNINPNLGKYDYLQIIVDFINSNDIIYALSIVDIIIGITELSNRLYQEYNKNVKSDPIIFDDRTRFNYFRDCRYALRHLRDFLQLHKEFIQNVDTNSDNLNRERKKIVKPLIYKIDGAMALAKEIGVDSFIQYALEQCYFFDPEIVEKRRVFIETCFKNKYYIYARNSTSVKIESKNTYIQEINESKNIDFKELNKIRKEYGLSIFKAKKDTKYRWFSDTDTTYKISQYPIIIDEDGNKELRSVINNMTGYTVGAGKDNIFQNYRISHIWGRAYDPRFFTNLWNVVLVPAWANDLLDKPNPNKGSLESRLKSTIMNICIQLYFKNKEKPIIWKEINLIEPCVVKDFKKDIVKPKDDTGYSINVIKGIGKGSKIGDIKKMSLNFC